MSKIILHHASTVEVKAPIWDYKASSRILEESTADFGEGFYLSEDKEQPIKLLCSNEKVVLNRYELSLGGLKVLEFGLDTEWLLTVAFHRRSFLRKAELHELRDYYRKLAAESDVIIGPIANDRMFSTIQLFIDSIITDEMTIASMNIMEYNNQFVLKSKKACDAITFLDSQIIEGNLIEKYKNIVINEKISMEERLEDIREEYIGRGQLFRQIIRQKVNKDAQ